MADLTSTAAKPSEAVLRPSLLSAKADAMWTASKEQFQNSGKIISMGAIKLKTKTFSEVSANTKKDEDTSDTLKPKFIFGQNVASRLIKSGLPAKADSTTREEPTKTGDLFKSGEKNAIKAQTFEDFKKEAALVAAKEKDEHEKNLPTTSVIEVKTGEEDDHVLFQTGCKLHVFDKQQKNWIEKGMAVMKISKRYDEEGEHYRIIARTTGIHKLVINSPVFADMILERVDQKRLKISAMGADEPPSLQIFLVTFSFTNSELSIDGAWNTLQSLINKCKQDSKNRKRKASEIEQVTEVEAKMEKTDIDDSDQDVNKSGGFEDEHSASSVEPSDAQDPALDTDGPTTSDAGTDSN